jgi:hypothetical protein
VQVTRLCNWGIITREHYDGTQMIRKETSDDFTFFLSTEAGCAAAFLYFPLLSKLLYVHTKGGRGENSLFASVDTPQEQGKSQEFASLVLSSLSTG